MPETGGLDRKRKVRAAHRGSVTRIVGQVYESLESGDALSVPRLRQQKSLLSGKLDLLSKLDDELIEMVAEDELDHEVEQADVIKERIDLCIMDIDKALKRTSSHVVTDPATTGDDSSRTTPSTKDSDSTHTHPGGPPTPPSTEMGGDPPTLPPPTDPTDPALTLPSTVPTTGDTTLVTPSSLITSHVKLPKLSIKKFNGDLTKWVTPSTPLFTATRAYQMLTSLIT